MKKYNILLIHPEDYPHSAAFYELIESLFYAFNALGIDFMFYINEINRSFPNIVIGAHHLDENSMQNLPPETIIYNTEQIDDKSIWMTPSYLNCLQQFEVWDFSEENVQRLRERGVTRVKYVPVGYMPQLTRIPCLQQGAHDIDVLFYGSLNERRKHVIEALVQRGVRVKHIFGTYREERDALITRAKIVLNMHYYDTSVFEIVRVSYLLANGKAVVTESSAASPVMPLLKNALCAVPYDGLVEACINLLADDALRADLETRALSTMAQLDERRILQRVLSLPDTPPPNKGLPSKLNLGSGKDWRSDCLNADIIEAMRPDIVLDIESPSLFDVAYQTKRFGDVNLHANLFDEITANDVLEHLVDLKTAMTNCLHLLKPGGLFRIMVPYDLSHGAWQDPTHVRAFNESSWYYYTDWFWYMGWKEARFDCLTSSYVLTPLGEALLKTGVELTEVARTPRAVSHLSVVLRKRYLLESETQKINEFIQRPWDTEEGQALA